MLPFSDRQLERGASVSSLASTQLPHKRPVGMYRHVLAAGDKKGTREQSLRLKEDQGVRWSPRGR